MSMVTFYSPSCEYPSAILYISYSDSINRGARHDGSDGTDFDRPQTFHWRGHGRGGAGVDGHGARTGANAAAARERTGQGHDRSASGRRSPARHRSAAGAKPNGPGDPDRARQGP